MVYTGMHRRRVVFGVSIRLCYLNEKRIYTSRSQVLSIPLHFFLDSIPNKRINALILSLCKGLYKFLLTFWYSYFYLVIVFFHVFASSKLLFVFIWNRVFTCNFR